MQNCGVGIDIIIVEERNEVFRIDIGLSGNFDVSLLFCLILSNLINLVCPSTKMHSEPTYKIFTCQKQKIENKRTILQPLLGEN